MFQVELESPKGERFDIQIKPMPRFFARDTHQSHSIICHKKKPYINCITDHAPHFDINGHRLVPVFWRKRERKVIVIDKKTSWSSLQGAVAYTRECNPENVHAIIKMLANSGAVAIFVDCDPECKGSIPIFNMSQIELNQIERLDRIGATVFLRRSFRRGKSLLCHKRSAPPKEGRSKLVQAIPSRSIFGRVCGVQNSKEEVNGATVTCSETDLKSIQIITRKLAQLGAYKIMVTRDPRLKVNAHVLVNDILTIEYNNRYKEVEYKVYRKV